MGEGPSAVAPLFAPSPHGTEASSRPTPGTPLLPGERLDYRACEALEEVFKRLQFKVVDLEQTNLDEDVSSLHHCPSRAP